MIRFINLTEQHDFLIGFSVLNLLDFRLHINVENLTSLK